MLPKKIALKLKHVSDSVFAIVFLLALLPLLIVIAILIKLNSRGPAFFKQERVGINGKQFTIYKFRTMVDNAVNIGAGHNIVDNDPRITTIGKFLRAWSLDELPQLINIVKNEMSIIGPRPTLQYQVDGYSPHQRKRLDMKPGVTGWAQVNGRNNLTWEQRIEMDIWYVENWSLELDAKIFLRTFKVVFAKNDVYTEGGISYDFSGPEKAKKE
jgi:lipopolysaccharide/colanic/teichoic acid biosynthesis glycosyltransferase